MIDEFRNDTFLTTEKPANETIGRSRIKIVLVGLLVIIISSVCLFLFIKFIQTPPVKFLVGVPIVIEPGTSMKEAIAQVKKHDLVHSEIALYLVLMLKYSDNSIKASTYIFDRPLSLSELAYELTQGDHRSDLIKITNTEGETAATIAKRAEETLSKFEAKTFLTLAKTSEGKLFPETYYIPKDYSEAEYLNLLTATFDEKISTLETEIINHPLTLEEIIILASILEREANTKESKRIVSGILQKRLDISMPLQVDASLEYILDKPLSELTAEDLDTESPYNTYLNYGLPPTPIGNPGLESIEAVLNPEKSDYLFYITGDDGKFYYAKNFDAHRNNIAKYLR
jgi:UPF0755 protein